MVLDAGEGDRELVLAVDRMLTHADHVRRLRVRANADTPGYVPSLLEFDQQRQEALAGEEAQPASAAPGNPAFFPIGGAGGIAAVQPEVLKTAGQSQVGDGNGVAVDQEMVDLAKNEILYEAATQMLNKKFGLLKYVVQEGKG